MPNFKQIANSLMGSSGSSSGGTGPGLATGLRSAKVNAIDVEKFLAKCHVPSLHEDAKQETFWAHVMQPMMGQTEYGHHFMPEVGDVVVVAFLDGDYNSPVVVGGIFMHFKPTQKVKLTNEDAETTITDAANDFRGIISRSKGHLIFGDKGGEEIIELRTTAGHILSLQDKGGAQKIQLYEAGRKQFLEVDVEGKKVTIQTDSGEVYIKAKSKITMECEDFILNASKSITVESGTTSEWKAGSTMKQESGATFDIEGGGTVTIKGPKIDLNP